MVEAASKSRWQVDLALFFLGLFLGPENGSDMFLRNVGSTDYTALKSRKIESSELLRFVIVQNTCYVISMLKCFLYKTAKSFSRVLVCISTTLTYWMSSPPPPHIYCKSLNLPRAATLNRARKSLILFPCASWKQNVCCKNGSAPFSLVLWYPMPFSQS
jgi:hypothetical protein